MVLCDKIQSPLSGTSWGERDRPPGRWGTAQAKAEALWSAKAEALWSAARAGANGPVRRAQGPHCLNVSRCGGRGTRRSHRFVRGGRGRRGAASHQKRSRLFLHRGKCAGQAGHALRVKVQSGHQASASVLEHSSPHAPAGRQGRRAACRPDAPHSSTCVALCLMSQRG